jgi:sulfatase maturation enzyme AslB (radical SAM superfamily)
MTAPATDRTRRTCSCGAEVVWTNPDAPTALSRVDCPACGEEHLFSWFIKMDVALTEACNYGCVMCRRPSDPLILRKPEVYQALHEAARIGLELVSFCGGEPFMHRDFVEIAEESIRLGLKVQMVTHGGLVTQAAIDRLHGLDCFTVSIDGTAATHDELRRVEGAHPAALRALNMAADAGITCGTNTVIQAGNHADLWDSYQAILEGTGGRVDYIRHAPVEVLPESANLMVPTAEVALVADQLQRIADDCEARDIFFVHRSQLLDHLPKFMNKWTRHRPKEGCHIPQRFIGYSKLGYYLCWHQGNSIKAGGLIEALSTPQADAVVQEALAKECVGCNALTYSWDEPWNEGILDGILAGEVVDDGALPHQKTTVHEGASSALHKSRASLNIIGSDWA